jgi:hypothetical protein
MPLFVLQQHRLGIGSGLGSVDILADRDQLMLHRLHVDSHFHDNGQGLLLLDG